MYVLIDQSAKENDGTSCSSLVQHRKIRGKGREKGERKKQITNNNTKTCKEYRKNLSENKEGTMRISDRGLVGVGCQLDDVYSATTRPPIALCISLMWSMPFP